MTVYRITLERISTGERAPPLVVREPTEQAAREFAVHAIRESPTPDDLRVVEVETR